MIQQCMASTSSTGLHCAWCVTREIGGMSCAYCERHDTPCSDMDYYCDNFLGYEPDFRRTDEEERLFIEELRQTANR